MSSEKMDYFLSNNSECSSGCETGWTLYFENSYISPYNKENGFSNEKYDFSQGKKTEEEDLSMVSDASSGPPLFPEEEDCINGSTKCFYHGPVDSALREKSEKKQKLRENHRGKVNEKPSLLDDTASSPVFSLPNNNFPLTYNHAPEEEAALDFARGYSTALFEESSACQNQYGILYSSLSGNNLQQNQWFGGSRL